MLHVEFNNPHDVEVDYAMLGEEALPTLLATGFDYYDPFLNNARTVYREVCYALQAVATEEDYLRLYGDSEYDSVLQFLNALEGACDSNPDASVTMKEDN